MKIQVLVVSLFLAFSLHAQVGPGGVGNATDNVLWLSADNGVFSNTAGTTPAGNGDNVGRWADRSGNANHASHSTAAETPNMVTNVVNGLPVIRFTAVSGDRLLSSGVADGNAASVWTVTQWSSLASMNAGIIQASPPGLAFSTNTTDKVIGIWVSNANVVWGRGVQANGTQVNLPQNFATSSGTFYNILTHYDGSSTINQYVNSTNVGSVGYNGTLRPWSEFGIGRQANEGWNGDIAEVIVFNTAVNTAQRIIIDNYLAAKYNLSLSSNDLYTMDNAGNGNYDHEVAGIGRANATNIHSDAKGSGIVRVSNPTSLGNGDYFIWGHDNGSLQTSVTTGLPAGITARLARQWRVSETADVGSIDMDFYLDGLPDFSSGDECGIGLSLRLLVDTNNNGYADETPIAGAMPLGNNVYRFSGVSAIGNTHRFTLGVAVPENPADGPGGVGAKNGVSSLVLWLDASRVSGANGATITTWNDASGYGNHFTTGAGAVFNANGVNGYPTFSFNGSAHYFERPFSSSLMPGSLTILGAVNVASSGNYKALISNRDDPDGNETRGYIVYSGPSNNYWQFWNGHPTIAWQQTVSSVSTAGTWASITASYNGTSGAKELYIDNLLGASNTHSLHPNTIQPVRVGAGQNEDDPNFYFQGQMGEVIVYNTVLNSAQRIIVNNYLAAKYGFTLDQNDIYTQDDPGQGNFDHDVAGIGQVNASNRHDEAKGGIVKISNPSNLGNNEFLFWGHNGAPLPGVATLDLPAGIQGRFTRVWRVSEANMSGGSVNVGDVSIEVDLSGLGAITASDLRLLIDHDGDGVFAEGGTIQVPVSLALACDRYVFSVTGGQLTNGDRFTIGTTDITQTPLPIQLISFSGEMSNGNAYLRWKTLTETNNHFFTVERSTDGKGFTAVGEVEGSGTTKEETAYSFTDRQPPFGILYYRLRQTDFDDAYSYSDVIRLENAGTGTQVIATPNPVDGDEILTLTIRHHEKIDMRSVSIRVLDVVGRERMVRMEADGQSVKIQLGNQPPGVYLITAYSAQLEAPLTVRILVR